MMTRRRFLAAAAAAPFASWACSSRPQTPLAHLHGKEWVAGVYELHARRYLDVQEGAETESHGVYRVLAQKGVTALEALQAREVPFYMRVDARTAAFTIERTVPERLTFTAEMTDDDRREATEAWKKAREHIHTDYFEIHRLDWAMTTLLEQLVRIHGAMEQAEIEQFKIVRDLGALRAGGATPYQLPKGVSRGDYEDVLVLLLARLEDDRHRLETIEASIAAVGLTSRATDAGSGSLAANIHKVMLSVIRDAEATTPRPAEFPRQSATREELLANGREIAKAIEASAEYQRWKRDEEAKALESVGVLFSAVETITHVPTSTVFRAVVDIWRGDGDYLDALESLARLVPGGGEVAKTVAGAIDTTKKVRRATRTLIVPGAHGKGAIDAAARAAIDEGAGGVLNTATAFGRARIDRQLAFFAKKSELREVSDAVGASDLMTKAMPDVAAIAR